MDQPDHDVESLHQADNLMTYLSNVEYFILSDDFMRPSYKKEFYTNNDI